MLQAMAEQLRNIRGEKQPEKLRLEIVRLAVELLGGEFGGLCRNRSAVEDLELLVPWGFTPQEEPFLIAYGEGIIGQTAVEAKPQLVNAYAAEDRLLRSERTAALLSTPFLHGTEVEAVLFVGSRSPGRTFDRTIRRYSNCLQNNRQLHGAHLNSWGSINVASSNLRYCIRSVIISNTVKTYIVSITWH